MSYPRPIPGQEYTFDKGTCRVIHVGRYPYPMQKWLPFWFGMGYGWAVPSEDIPEGVEVVIYELGDSDRCVRTTQSFLMKFTLSQ